MTPVHIDPEAVRSLAAARGIDTVRQLAEKTGLSEHVLYHAMRRRRMLPSHAIIVANTLDVPIAGPDGFARQEATA